MIKGFASKVLRRAFEDGNYRRINPQWRARVELLLDALDAAEKVEDLNLLTLGTHPLKGNRKGEWGMTVTKNWRITFRFEVGDAVEVDLEEGEDLQDEQDLCKAVSGYLFLFELIIDQNGARAGGSRGSAPGRR